MAQTRTIGNIIINPQYYAEQTLPVRGYSEKLEEEVRSMCSSLYDPLDTTICVQELKPLFDCVLRKKAGKFGTLTPNISLCHSESLLLKTYLPRAYPNTNSTHFQAIDLKLHSLNGASTSFV